MKLAIIGCGAIGSIIAKEFKEDVEFLYDIDKNKSIKLAKDLGSKVKVANKFDEILESDVSLVVECASQKAVLEYGFKVIESAKDFMILSVGALVDLNFFEKLKQKAEYHKRRIYIPSGAVAGIDAIKAVKDKVSEIILITRKNPASFGLDLKEEKTIFDGYAKEAVKLFPKNINVSATISIAGVGFDKTKVKIIADPEVKQNIHQIFVKGEFGEFSLEVKNVKISEQTSYLSALSAISLIKELKSPVKIGS